ncbi:MAG: asparagine synthase (glutamine-hydrolyzing) [Gemmatimonadetes bacterium]|nr:MAG: asparagine synthase (glutamine-hydrolyzing) [Gemmatimonadota bacterium]
MCGITGFWKHPGESMEVMTQWGDAMNDTLRHRGPDDGGLWADDKAGVVLASRRLAILDLSPAGHQPMTSHRGRYVLAYNGEIYNFLEIRRDLEREGEYCVSNSDTEVLLEACALWGIEPALSRLNGMFSFALWDTKEHTLTLVRDRLGVKPLYYGWTHNTFLFGSELKALHSFPDFTGTVDRSSVALFLRLGYVPAPYSIYENIYKLPPGHLLTISAPRQHTSPRSYWCARRMAEAGVQNRFRGDIHEAADEMELLLRDSVRLRMLADVPVGAFLSGGIDSSLIAAMMQAQTTSTVKTFTIGFTEASHNEADYAKEIAEHLGSEHTDVCLSPKDAQDIIPLLPGIYDEPFADPSQIPTFLVAQLARQSVTVSLSGDGGDELFGGYREYVLGTQRWRRLRRLSPIVRSLIREGAKGIGLLGVGRLRKIEQLLDVTTPEAMHQYHLSQWMWPADLVPAAGEHLTPFTDPTLYADALTDTERMMYMDLVTYLPEDILTKLDRASMAVSLEARVPLLDYRLVEFAWQLPLDFKLHRGRGKRILRSILTRYVPPRLFERPKMGFGLPLGQWLRGPLRPWVEELLDPTKLRQQGVFNPMPVCQAWMEHLHGTQNRAIELWGILMFQAWQEKWI